MFRLCAIDLYLISLIFVGSLSLSLSLWHCELHMCFSALWFANFLHALLLLCLQLYVANRINLFISLQHCVACRLQHFDYVQLSVARGLIRLSVCSDLWLVDSTVCLCAAMCGSWTQPFVSVQRCVARGLPTFHLNAAWTFSHNSLLLCCFLFLTYLMSWCCEFL